MTTFTFGPGLLFITCKPEHADAVQQLYDSLRSERLISSKDHSNWSMRLKDHGERCLGWTAGRSSEEKDKALAEILCSVGTNI